MCIVRPPAVGGWKSILDGGYSGPSSHISLDMNFVSSFDLPVVSLRVLLPRLLRPSSCRLCRVFPSSPSPPAASSRRPPHHATFRFVSDSVVHRLAAPTTNSIAARDFAPSFLLQCAVLPSEGADSGASGPRLRIPRVDRIVPPGRFARRDHADFQPRFRPKPKIRSTEV